MKTTRIVVTRGITATGSYERTWSKAEYTVEMGLEDQGEIQVAKVEAEAS